LVYSFIIIQTKKVGVLMSTFEAEMHSPVPKGQKRSADDASGIVLNQTSSGRLRVTQPKSVSAVGSTIISSSSSALQARHEFQTMHPPSVVAFACRTDCAGTVKDALQSCSHAGHVYLVVTEGHLILMSQPTAGSLYGVAAMFERSHFQHFYLSQDQPVIRLCLEKKNVESNLKLISKDVRALDIWVTRAQALHLGGFNNANNDYVPWSSTCQVNDFENSEVDAATESLDRLTGVMFKWSVELPQAVFASTVPVCSLSDTMVHVQVTASSMTFGAVVDGDLKAKVEVKTQTDDSQLAHVTVNGTLHKTAYKVFADLSKISSKPVKWSFPVPGSEDYHQIVMLTAELASNVKIWAWSGLNVPME
jgi:hypothetical protein